MKYDNSAKDVMFLYKLQVQQKILCLYYRCHEAGGVTALAAIREHVHILQVPHNTSINADVSIMRVHRAKELIGKLILEQNVFFYCLQHCVTHSFLDVQLV